jgi:hypothetical protein
MLSDELAEAALKVVPFLPFILEQWWAAGAETVEP